MRGVSLPTTALLRYLLQQKLGALVLDVSLCSGQQSADGVHGDAALEGE